MTTYDIPVRLDFDAEATIFSKALSHLDNAAAKQADAAGLDQRLRDLVKLRASQLNGCAYCVDMHTKDLRAAGETDVRLAGLVVWQDTPFFTVAERAALRFTEAVVTMAQHHVPQAEFDAVAAAYSPSEIAALLAVIVTINAWNGIGVAAHPWEPGSYEV